ncbi:MAG: hypothetical protein HOQ20_17530, partial [Bradyrhizobium sp.]|nr:hypothetical protein [Bradyrhizobium sp.]
SPPSIVKRSRPPRYAPVNAVAKLQVCIVQLQHEMAPRTANIWIMSPAAASTFQAASSERPGFDHCINSVASSPRR